MPGDQMFAQMTLAHTTQHTPTLAHATCFTTMYMMMVFSPIQSMKNIGENIKNKTISNIINFIVYWL